MRKFFVFLFILIIFLPITFYVVGFNPDFGINENRVLQGRPSLKIGWKYLADYQAHFNDYLPLRKGLVFLNHVFKISVLKTSPNEDVVIGKDNWFFNAPNDAYIDLLNGHPFSESELSEISSNLEEVTNYFQSQGIKTYFLIAPNTQSIYEEYLPTYMVKVNSDSRLDQITKYLANKQTVNFINPAEELQLAKSEIQTYRRFDIHWNDYGAFVAYQKLFNDIQNDFPEIKPASMEEFNITYDETKNKDFDILLGLNNVYTEQEPFLTFKNPTVIKRLTEECIDPYTKCPLVINETQTNSNLKLVMFRDSFAVNLIPFISPHFQRSVYIWDSVPHNVDVIAEEKPEVIIFEITERELWRLKDKLFNI